MSEYFAGVVVESNNLSSVDSITLLLGKDVEYVGEESLSAAFEGRATGDAVITYQANHQCLLLMDIDYAIDGFMPEGCAALSFSVADTSAAYQWLLWGGDTVLSQHQGVGGMVLEEHGDSLDVFGDDPPSKIKGYISRLLKKTWPELAAEQAELYRIK